MSDDISKALARIAALEAQLSSRNTTPAPSTPQPAGIDPQQLARALASDPVGTMSRLGVPVDHVSRVLVAHQLGDAAPPELRMLAQQGPLVSATQAIASDLQTMRQRLESFEERDRKAARRSSFSALAVDKTKYPTLAAAYAKNPALFDSDVDGFQGDPAALADTLEQRLAALAPAVGATPPASDGNAENTGQSSQAKAQPGAVDQTPPPIPQAKPGVWTQEAHQELKERILRKYES